MCVVSVNEALSVKPNFPQMIISMLEQGQQQLQLILLYKQADRLYKTRKIMNTKADVDIKQFFFLRNVLLGHKKLVRQECELLAKTKTRTSVARTSEIRVTLFKANQRKTRSWWYTTDSGGGSRSGMRTQKGNSCIFFAPINFCLGVLQPQNKNHKRNAPYIYMYISFLHMYEIRWCSVYCVSTLIAQKHRLQAKAQEAK